MFDLPMEKPKQRRAYNQFRRFLLKNGFLMLQKSVYVKLTLNPTAAQVIMHNVRLHSPEEGLIQMITITEKQFTKMEYVIGQSTSELIDSTDRILIL